MRSVRAGPGSKRPRVTTPGSQAITSTVTNGTATVTRLADQRAKPHRGQWWGDYRMWSWDTAELSRWTA
jgi:hypothetical protein